MPYIEPHAHMVSRTTDDYQALALAQCSILCEPAFWAGFDRRSAEGFYDYFSQLTIHEPKRAAQYGIDHYCWLCINPKEADDVGFAREVMSLIPQFIKKPTVLGIGEIGLNKNTVNELLIFEEHLALAQSYNLPVLIHTPHLEDKQKGTRLILDALKNCHFSPNQVLIDHVEEHTIAEVLDAGYFAGMTLYPQSKCSLARAVDMAEIYKMERLCVNSACDWGVSDPLAVPKFSLEMRKRGHSHKAIDTMTYANPMRFLQNTPPFQTQA